MLFGTLTDDGNNTPMMGHSILLLFYNTLNAVFKVRVESFRQNAGNAGNLKETSN